MIVKEASNAEKLACYKRTVTYIKQRLEEATINYDGLAQLYRRASTEERVELVSQARVAAKKVQHWRFLLGMLEPPPKVLTGIFPGEGRDEIKSRRGIK